MMADVIPVNRPAATRNIAAFSALVSTVVERRPDGPGLACFYGPSGYGKTRAATFGANMYRALYVECGPYTTARGLLQMILVELGVQRPRGTISDMVSEAVMMLSADRRRPLIIDEAHYVAMPKVIDMVGELHRKSLAPIILIGEESLPKKMEAFERVQNRVRLWVPALPADGEDFARLVKVYCPKITVARDLQDEILTKTKGNTCRIGLNLDLANEVAAAGNLTTVDLAAFGGPSAIISSSAPPRRAA